jgi:hypothetical protein
MRVLLIEDDSATAQYPATSPPPKRTEADSENKDCGRTENYYQLRITHTCSLQIVM